MNKGYANTLKEIIGNPTTPNFKFTNAFTEGANNLCKVAKRQSHGFKLKDMYIRKLTAKFCYKILTI